MPRTLHLMPLRFAAFAAAAAILSLPAPVRAVVPVAGLRNSAPSDPANEALTRPDQFILNGRHDVERMHLARPHDVQICLPGRADVAGRRRLTGAQHYPIKVRWDSGAGQIWPGNCLSFDTARLTVRPSPAMPGTAHAVGTIHVF